MKTLRLIGMVLFAALMCVNFAACGGSDDEPENEKINLVGTAWSQNGDDDIFCFNANGELVCWDSYSEYKAGDEEGVYDYMRWSIEGNVLSIIDESGAEYWNIISYSSKQMVLERQGRDRQWKFTRVN